MPLDKIPVVRMDASGTAGSTTFLRGDNTWSSTITSGTAQASTSGTFIDFTGIPATAKRITVMFSGVSTSGTSIPLVQIGSGSITATGYVSMSTAVGSGGTGSASSTIGFLVQGNGAAEIRYAHLVITLISGSSYVSSHSGMTNNTQAISGGGGVTLASTLDRIRITTVNGTDTFDAGSVNILAEG